MHLDGSKARHAASCSSSEARMAIDDAIEHLKCIGIIPPDFDQQTHRLVAMPREPRSNKNGEGRSEKRDSSNQHPRLP